LAAIGLFGDSDSVERLARALGGADGHSGVARALEELRDRVSRTVGSLVPDEWSGEAADAFARQLSGQDVRDLQALSGAVSGLGNLLLRLAADIRVANGRGERAKATAHAAGFDIDSHGTLSSSDPLHAVEQLIPGAVDTHATTAARDEMLAARRVAESAWDAARRALANVPVPRIGTDTWLQAEKWGFANAAPPHPFPPGRGATLTGLPPTEPRSDPSVEVQRTGGIALVQQHCQQIVEAARQYGVPPEAIAGAILWEAIEDPAGLAQRMGITRGPGPGKVHYFELGKPAAAGLAEIDGKINRSSSVVDRFQRVRDPDSAIRYIGAILSDSADAYRKEAGVDISQDVGVLLTLYEEGDAEQKARSLSAARAHDPSASPSPGGDMGPWVVENLPWVRGQLTCLE
jgi:hypothetical protein